MDPNQRGYAGLSIYILYYLNFFWMFIQTVTFSANFPYLLPAYIFYSGLITTFFGSALNIIDLKSNDVYDLCKTEKIKKIMKIACLFPHLGGVIPISRALGGMADSGHSMKHGWICYLIKIFLALSNLGVGGYFASSGFSGFVMLLFTLHMVLMFFMRENIGRQIWGIVITIVLFLLIIGYTMGIVKIYDGLKNSGKNNRAIQNDESKQVSNSRKNNDVEESKSDYENHERDIIDNQPKYPVSNINQNDDEEEKREYWKQLTEKKNNVTSLNDPSNIFSQNVLKNYNNNNNYGNNNSLGYFSGIHHAPFGNTINGIFNNSSNSYSQPKCGDSCNVEFLDGDNSVKIVGRNGHIFHPSCIKERALQKKTCPSCNIELI